MIVPVAVPQLGCTLTLAAGVAGADGAAFTTRPVRAAEVPQLLVDVTE